jgi:hypothetical protein
MNWDDVLWHVMNFALPAAVLSLGITAWGSFQFRHQAQIRWIWRWLLNAIAAITVLLAGLILTGNDGKMATYGALVMVCATVEWLMQMQRSFKRRG